MLQVEFNRRILKYFEKVLKNDSDNLKIRMILLGNYFTNHLQSKFNKKNRHKHIIWAIKNLYDSPVLNDAFVFIQICHDYEPSFFKVTTKLWLTLLEKNPNNPQVLVNVGNALAYFDPNIKFELLKRALKLEPSNSRFKISYRSLIKCGQFNNLTTKNLISKYSKNKHKKIYIEGFHLKCRSFIKSLFEEKK